MDDFLKIFKALSDKNRVGILKMLELKSLCVCKFPNILGLAMSTVSTHLSILKEVGFIQGRQKGKWVEYSLNRTSPNPILHQILAMLPGWLNDYDEVIEDKKR